MTKLQEKQRTLWDALPQKWRNWWLAEMGGDEGEAITAYWKRHLSLNRLHDAPTMTPSDIEVLLHCHVCPAPHPRREAPAVKAALCYFEDVAWLIEKVEGEKDVYRTTERGKALVNMLCHTPLPEARYVDPRTEEAIPA